MSHHNTHDLISMSARVVTINFAAGIEAHLHREPVVLCGQSDFHHIADVARTSEGLPEILQSTPRKCAYDKLIWWYSLINVWMSGHPIWSSGFAIAALTGSALWL